MCYRLEYGDDADGEDGGSGRRGGRRRLRANRLQRGPGKPGFFLDKISEVFGGQASGKLSFLRNFSVFF